MAGLLLIAGLVGARGAAGLVANVDKSNALPQTTAVAWVRDGYEHCDPYIRMYDGPHDNPGTDNETMVAACAIACAGKYTPAVGTWDWDADGISLCTKQDHAQRGRCYCVRLDDTCADWGSPDLFQTFAFVPPTPASAVGDPHLQNIHGEKFDLARPGNHVLIQIPRGAHADETLLRVGAEARKLGAQCGDMYFQKVNISGMWAEAKHSGGYCHSVFAPAIDAPEWVTFGRVALKIVHGRTENGINYLNVYAKHLGQSGYPVGGLLGEDDHADVSVLPEGCSQHINLRARGPSVATAFLA
jgi:hypothetical protein